MNDERKQCTTDKSDLKIRNLRREVVVTLAVSKISAFILFGEIMLLSTAWACRTSNTTLSRS